MGLDDLADAGRELLYQPAWIVVRWPSVGARSILVGMDPHGREPGPHDSLFAAPSETRQMAEEDHQLLDAPRAWPYAVALLVIVAVAAAAMLLLR